MPEQAVVDALLGLADVVHLPAAEHGAAYAALGAQVPWLTELPGAESWIAPLPPPRMEQALTRFEADCRRAARRGAEITMRLASTPDEVVVALERLFVLHAERWRMRGGEIPRFSTTEAHRAWYRRVIAAMAERDEALIAEVIEDGELFGAELALTAGRGGVLHTTAIRLGGKLDEPGRASKLQLIRALEEAGVQAVDLGCGACEPGSPKSAVGPTRVVVKRLLAADSSTVSACAGCRPGAPRALAKEEPVNARAGETLAAVLAGPEGDAAVLICPDDGVALTLDELVEAVDRLSGRLSALGVKRSGRVALSLPNGPEIVVALLALARVGAAAAPLNPAYTAAEFRFYLEDIRPQLLLLPRGGLPAAREAAAAAVPVAELSPGHNGELVVELDGRSAARGGHFRGGRARRRGPPAPHERHHEPAKARSTPPPEPDGDLAHDRRPLPPGDG